MAQSSPDPDASVTLNVNAPAGPSYSANNGSMDGVDSITSIYDKYAPSIAPSHMSEAGSVAISGSMPPRKILAQLQRHGCKDITSWLNHDTVTHNSVSNGGFGDVYREQLLDGRRVAIKCARILPGMNEEGEKQVKNAARELHVWSKCKHPNIQQLIGVALYKSRVAMVSPWMKNGNLSWYISQHTDVDRYNLCVQAAAAVAYLRECGVVHGDIKGANYLVSDDGVVKLTDFGGSTISQCSLKFTSPDSSTHTTLRWTAPEIFAGETQTTYEGDVYALGMTILEIFTGSVPWKDVRDPAVMNYLNQRQVPSRPEEHMPVEDELLNSIWELMLRCWDSEPKKRPFSMKVRDDLDVINKRHQLDVYGPEDTFTSEISADTRSLAESANDIQQSDTGSISVLSSRNSLLDRLLRRPSSRSLSSLGSSNRRPRSIASLLSLSDVSHIPSIPSLEADTSSVISTSTRWSGSLLGPRRGPRHLRSSSVSSVGDAHPGIARYELTGNVDEEGFSHVFPLSATREPVINDDLNASVATLQMVDKEPGPTHRLPSTTRKALILGSPYEDTRLFRQLRGSYQTKDSVPTDLERMESVFRERGYSLQKQILEGFDRKSALALVAQFLDGSKSGDVRAILFTGWHTGVQKGTHSLSLTHKDVPRNTRKPSQHIPFKEWEQNIRDHSRPGVIVFSIMTPSYSGQILRQEFDRHVWEAPTLIKPINKDQPTYLTFAASDGDSYSRGLTPPPEQVPIGNHFIHALVGATRSVDTATSTWEEFFEEFDRQFLRTRSYASFSAEQATGELNLNWRLNNPQTPRFSASAFVALSDIF